MPSDRRAPLVLSLAALIAVLPLILRGCSCGHDFDFHIINWFEAARHFAHGNLQPHWASTPAWNAGEPRFVFYPPLSWMLGALLGLILPWTWTPIAYTWIALTAAGLALYYCARSFAPPAAALIASCIYLANPYTLYTVYERSAYAELLAAAWLPLALYAIVRERVTVTGLAVPIALLWLTNAPAAVMGTYMVIFIAVLRLAFSFRLGAFALVPSRIVFAVRKALGILLGLGLAALYVIPAAYERRFVQIGLAIVPGLSPQENFLFRHTSDPEHDAVLHTASVLAIVLLLLTAGVLLYVQARLDKLAITPPRASRFHCSAPALIITLMVMTAAIAFMLTPLSSPLWRYLPELRFLQFPWRLLAITAVVFAFALAMALSRIAHHATPIALAAAVIFTVPAYVAFQQRCYPEDALAARLSIFQSDNPGTDPTDEYTPVTADNDVLLQTNPGYWLAPTSSQPAPPDLPPEPAPHTFEIDASAPSVLVLNLRDYPAWNITINGVPVTTRLHRDDGLIALPLPAGHFEVRVHYVIMRDQQIGYFVSALSLLLLTAIFILRHRVIFPGDTEHSATAPLQRLFG